MFGEIQQIGFAGAFPGCRHKCRTLKGGGLARHVAIAMRIPESGLPSIVPVGSGVSGWATATLFADAILAATQRRELLLRSEWPP